MHVETPVFIRNAGTRQTRTFALKLENLQPAGSFKIRGIGMLCQHAVEGGATSFVCASGGNAGVAAAYAGTALGRSTTVVVPESTTTTAISRIEHHGGHALRYGKNYDEARDRAIALAEESNAFFVPPFDHPLIWEGHSTLIDEALRQTEFDSVVCSVGGGGLLAGIVAGLQRNGLSIPVFAVETVGAASLAAAMTAGAATTLPIVSTVATSLAARRVCDQGFKVTQTHDVRSVVVSDEAALRACLRFVDEERMLVEPACGAALAVMYEDIVDWGTRQRPLIVVCGGNGVGLELARGWRDHAGA